MTITSETPPVSSHHLQQQELVTFLYERFRMGRHITLFVSSLAALLAYVELSIQGREHWVLLWYGLLFLIMMLRARHLKQFLAIRSHGYFPYQKWHDEFLLGVVGTGLMLGCGAALAMSFVTTNLQIILHSLLLTMSAGAIAYLSTSLRVYMVYMVTIMLPVTIWLFLQGRSATYLHSLLYLFFMAAGFVSVKRMHQLVNDALYYRYDNETLIDYLHRLLQSVSQTNKALEKISTTDELTGVASYRAFRIHLEEIWRQYQGSKLPISLIKLNIDYFYEFNVHYGQEVSDRQLQVVAGILNDQITDPQQMVARLQGAEFAVLLPGMNAQDARQIARTIHETLGERQIEHARSACSKFLTMSLGVGSQTVAPRSFSRELLARVDTALRLARERGHDRLEVLEA